MSSKHIRGDFSFAYPSARDRGDGPRGGGRHRVPRRAGQGGRSGRGARRATWPSTATSSPTRTSAASLGYVDEVIRPRETRAKLMPRAGGDRQQARHEPTQETREHPVVKSSGVCLPSSGGRRVARVGCATRAAAGDEDRQGAVVVTRAVSPEAYEHVTRADAARGGRALEGGRRRAAARAAVRSRRRRGARRPGRAVHPARPAGRRRRADRSARCRSRRRSTGYLARAHLAEAHTTTRPTARRSIPALREATALALDDDDPEAVERAHLELADAQVAALDLPAALDTARKLVSAAPETLRGRVQLAMLAWPTGALDEAAKALAGAIEREPNDVEARLLLGELHIATSKIARRQGELPGGDRPRRVADGGRRRVRGLAGAARRRRRGAGAGRSAGRRTRATPTRWRRRARSSGRSSARTGALALAERAGKAGPDRRHGRRC